MHRAVTSWMWEIKLKMTEKWTNELENGSCCGLWERGEELTLPMAIFGKQRTERDQREGKLS